MGSAPKTKPKRHKAPKKLLTQEARDAHESKADADKDELENALVLANAAAVMGGSGGGGGGGDLDLNDVRQACVPGELFFGAGVPVVAVAHSSSVTASVTGM